MCRICTLTDGVKVYTQKVSTHLTVIIRGQRANIAIFGWIRNMGMPTAHRPCLDLGRSATGG